MQVTLKSYPHSAFLVAGGLPTRDELAGQDDFSQAGARYRFYDGQRQARACCVIHTVTVPRHAPCDVMMYGRALVPLALGPFSCNVKALA